MIQFFYEQLEPAVIDMELKVQKGCICTLTKGDELDYKKNRSSDKEKTKRGYVLSVSYPSGQATLEDLPEWEGWEVGKESKRVAAVGGRLAWL